MPVDRSTSTPFYGDLQIIATLAGRAIDASIAELKREDELTIALRTALRSGVDINELSAVSGLPVATIKRRIERELSVLSDVDALVGLR